VLLHFRPHVPRPNVYCTARSEGTGYSCRCGSAMGQWQGLVPALGPGVRSLVVPVPIAVPAKRFDTTSGDVDVSLATFAVRLSPGLKAIQDT
jgi:hypothetical protein